MSNIVAIIQARMRSSRLPDKVLLPIAGRPMLQWVVERTRRAQTVNQVIVATTIDPSDDPVAEFCRSHGIIFSRGSVNDVLDRYYQAAKQYRADVVVRITADCPLIDPALIDQAVCAMFTSPNEAIDTDHCPLTTVHWDFIANRLPEPWWRTYPIGLDTEVFTFDALEQAWEQAEETHQREHVAPFFYEDIPVEDLHYSINKVSLAKSLSPRGFKVGLLHYHKELGHHRWTVDTPEDLELVRAVAACFPDDRFSWLDVLALVDEEPEIARLNAAVQHKTHLDVDERPR